MGFEIPQCCSLRAGSIIIASIQLLVTLLYTVGVSVSTILYMHKYNTTRTYEIAGFLLYVHSLFIHVLFALLLLLGIFKEKSGFVMAWLLFGTTELLDLIWSVAFSSLRFFHWSFFLEDLIAIGLEAAAVLVVCNYYNKMSKQAYVF